MADSEEREFVKELKKWCEEKKEGQDYREEKHSQKAGEVIHKIGLLYRKKSIALQKEEKKKMFLIIRSAGLLNAAKFRNPQNSQIKSDLSDLCYYILQQAEANMTNADLVKEAELIKNQIKKMRSEVETYFRTSVRKISSNITREEFRILKSDKIKMIKKINKTIAIKYKKIMAKLGQFCEDVMGSPPCEYAIVGMGSLAREEITPYSDFEHMILLCDDENYQSYLPYFRWFAVIFHVIILNLGETIIPSLDITSLNWFYDAKTPRGVSLDGMMEHASKFPLGHPDHAELINPVSEMLKYLSPETSRNDYHLADMLTNTCFVSGSENVYEQFLSGIKGHQNNELPEKIADKMQQQVKQDLDRFSARLRVSDLTSRSTINIKKFVYRSTTVFIPVLGSIHNVSGNSSFELIGEMAKNNKITKNTADKLRCAIAIACEMRLRVYMENGRQSDDAIDLKQDDMEKFLNIVGEASTVNYFQIAYCLQCEVAKQLKITRLLHFYSNPQLINIAIGLAFGIKDFIGNLKEPKTYFWDINKFDFDACIELLESQNILNFSDGKYFKLYQKIFKFFSSSYSSSPELSTKLNTEQILTIANQLKSAKAYDEALDFYKQLLIVYKKRNKNINFDYDVARANDQIGVCLNKLNEPKEALDHLYLALEIKKNTTSREGTDRNIAVTLHTISRCHINMQQYEKALEILNQELDIEKSTALNDDTDRNIAATLHTIGRCYTDMERYDEALENLQQALKIKQNTHKPDKYGIAMTLHEIGRCHFELQQYTDAKTNLSEALNLKREFAKRSPDTEKSIASTLHSIGRCHLELQEYKKAIKHLNEALVIKQNTTTLDTDKDRNIASTLHSIGRSQIGLNKYDDALKNLKRALLIKQNTTSDPNTDKSIAVTLHSIGLCFEETQNHAEALKHLEQSLHLYENLPRNNHINNKITSVRTKIEELKTIAQLPEQIEPFS